MFTKLLARLPKNKEIARLREMLAMANDHNKKLTADLIGVKSHQEKMRAEQKAIAFEISKRAPKHPILEIIFENGVPVFKGNEVVKHVANLALSGRGVRLESILNMPFQKEDKEQFLQLMGISISAYRKSSYVSQEMRTRVRVRTRSLEAELTKGTPPEILEAADKTLSFKREGKTERDPNGEEAMRHYCHEDVRLTSKLHDRQRRSNPNMAAPYSGSQVPHSDGYLPAVVAMAALAASDDVRSEAPTSEPARHAEPAPSYSAPVEDRSSYNDTGYSCDPTPSSFDS